MLKATCNCFKSFGEHAVPFYTFYSTTTVRRNHFAFALCVKIRTLFSSGGTFYNIFFVCHTSIYFSSDKSKCEQFKQTKIFHGNESRARHFFFFSRFDPSKVAEVRLSATDFPLFALTVDSCWALDTKSLFASA